MSTVHNQHNGSITIWQHTKRNSESNTTEPGVEFYIKVIYFSDIFYM